MATATPISIPIPTTQKEENHSKTPDLGQLQDQPPSDPPSNDASIDESKTIEDSPITEASTDIKNNDKNDVFDTKKKIRRADVVHRPSGLTIILCPLFTSIRGFLDHYSHHQMVPLFFFLSTVGVP
ncbi:hypothetical protein CsSME_00026064 [Camellia sinensis var. sinensis]